VFLFFAFVLPSDWRDLTFGLPGGASLTIKREAQIAQETLAGLLAALPADARRELVRPDELAPELEEAPAPLAGGRRPHRRCAWGLGREPDE
jgi:hypothetical protein